MSTCQRVNIRAWLPDPTRAGVMTNGHIISLQPFYLHTTRSTSTQLPRRRISAVLGLRIAGMALHEYDD